MKDALKNDRARIQVGRISSFGLMEMSRQRLRTGVLEASTKACPHCEGTGLMRTASSAGLSALRIIEDEAARGRGDRILLRAGREAAIYLLNKKRSELAEIEARYGVTIEVMIEESFEGARMSVESSGPRPMAPPRPVQEAPPIIDEDEDDFVEEEDEGEDEDEDEAEAKRGPRQPREPRDREEGEGGRRRRRRRRGGRGRRREGEGEASSEGGEEIAAGESEATAAEAEPVETVDSESEDKPKPRRGRRGGRGRGRRDEAAGEGPETVEVGSSPMVETPTADEEPIAETAPAEEATPVPSEAEGPKTRRRPRARAKVAEIEVTEPAPAEAPPAETAEEVAPEPAAKPKRKPRAKKADTVEAPAEAAVANDENGDDGEPRRGGWWQRTFG
jgi:ribonuclease E